MAYGAKDKQHPELHQHMKTIPSNGKLVDWDRFLKLMKIDTGESRASKIEVKIVKVDNSKNKR